MRYSVWNVGTRQFDYYDTAEAVTQSNTPKPDHLVSRTLGSTVEQACWRLPAAAVPAGSGPHAMGRVAIEPARALGGDDGAGMPITKGVLLLIAGALGVKFLMPRGRR